MYRGIFLLSLRGCVYAVGFTLLGLCCWVCAVGFVLLGLCCWVCAVGFVLLCLCCWVCAVVFVLLGLCCCVQNFVPPSTHAVVFSIVAFLFMPVSMLWSDFGYISCFFLPYVHFSHYSFLNFLCRGLFLDIFTSCSSIMSNFSHRPYHLFSDFPWFWIYFLFFSSLCPFLSSWALSFPPTWLVFGHIHFLKLHYVQFLL